MTPDLLPALAERLHKIIDASDHLLIVEPDGSVHDTLCRELAREALAVVAEQLPTRGTFDKLERDIYALTSGDVQKTLLIRLRDLRERLGVK